MPATTLLRIGELVSVPIVKAGKPSSSIYFLSWRGRSFHATSQPRLLSGGDDPASVESGLRLVMLPLHIYQGLCLSSD